MDIPTTYHILNGDCLAEQLKQTNIQGEFIVCSECLIDGDMTGDTLSQFYTTRAKYITDTYNTTTENYYNKCVIEFEKIINLPEGSEVCLWFENDLFCQTNMWFVLSLLNQTQTQNKVFRVFPIVNDDKDLWKGFGMADAPMLEQSYHSKVPFNQDDIKLANNLWEAYKASDFNKLKELSKHQSPCFQHLDDVCQAHVDRFPIDNSLGRPDKTVKEIIENKSKDFQIVFSEFSDREGIYGFGDLQVKNIMKNIMKNIITIIFCLYTFLGFGQSNSNTYKFSKEILSQIDKDTLAWKYQTGATALSFSGYYKDVLKIWDKNGVRKPKITYQDSLYFTNSKKVNAKDYVIEQSKHSRIVIINEAHHEPRHRMFTKSLLKGLYENGYRHLGLEALFDDSINKRKYPTIESGFYTKEPEFGNLIAEALKIGFTLFSYEASKGKNGKEREIEQAENIQKYIESNRDGKVLIHCGYAHAYENEYPAWGKAMAGRLKDNMNIDPLTIDQTMFLERSEEENNHLFINLDGVTEPVVLIGEDGLVFNGNGAIRQTDMVIVHPKTKYINNRPGWLSKGKSIYAVPSNKINNQYPKLVLAYRENELEHNGVPADIIEIIDAKSAKELYLKKGVYTIVITDENYEVVENYKIEVVY